LEARGLGLLDDGAEDLHGGGAGGRRDPTRGCERGASEAVAERRAAKAVAGDVQIRQMGLRAPF
jgi:hypothetical protein